MTHVNLQLHHCPTNAMHCFNPDLFLWRLASQCDTTEKIILLSSTFCVKVIQSSRIYDANNTTSYLFFILKCNVTLFYSKPIHWGRCKKSYQPPPFLQICQTMCWSYPNSSRYCIQAIGIFKPTTYTLLPHNARLKITIIYFMTPQFSILNFLC